MSTASTWVESAGGVRDHDAVCAVGIRPSDSQNRDAPAAVTVSRESSSRMEEPRASDGIVVT